MRGRKRSGKSMVLAMPMTARREPLRVGHSMRLYNTCIGRRHVIGDCSLKSVDTFAHNTRPPWNHDRAQQCTCPSCTCVSTRREASCAGPHVLVPVEQQVHLVDNDNRSRGTTSARITATVAKHVVQVLRRRCRPHAAARQGLRMLIRGTCLKQHIGRSPAAAHSANKPRSYMHLI